MEVCNVLIVSGKLWGGWFHAVEGEDGGKGGRRTRRKPTKKSKTITLVL